MPKLIKTICPYCGVGCGTIIKADKTGRILGVVPDKQHPTNKGVQCIKGLNADEPTYVDRLNTCLVRKDMSDPLRGYESATKGAFDDDLFEERRELRVDGPRGARPGCIRSYR